MKVYFSCSLTGGRADEAMYGAIVDWLLAAGHVVLTADLARPGVLSREQAMAAGEVYARDMAWVEEAEVLIAEVSTPSHGVGYEIAFALMWGKPTLCLYRQDARVSKMILGNSRPSLTLAAYADERAALAAVERFMQAAEERKRDGPVNDRAVRVSLRALVFAVAALPLVDAADGFLLLDAADLTLGDEPALVAQLAQQAAAHHLLLKALEELLLRLVGP